MRHRVGFLVLATALLVVSCAEGAAPAPKQVASSDPGGESSAMTAGRKLVRTVHLAIEVENPGETRTRVGELTAANGGFLERIEARGADSSESCRLVLRVPAGHLDAVLAEIRTLAGEVESETQEVRDVTSQSIDLDARLIGLTATEKELLALLKESRSRQAGVDEIIAVHRELTEVLTRIETIEAERKALGGQVSFATIDLEIRPERPAGFLALAWRPFEFAGECLRVLVILLELIAYALIFGIVVVLPLALLVIVPLKLRARMRGRAKPLSAPPLPPSPAA